MRTFYKGAAAVLLCFALDSLASFEKLEYWVGEIRENVGP